jgi:hypothetical protein
MTWALGLPTIFGYSGAIADVRVTCSDGTEHDCLQKMYRVGSEVAMSFAGSVKIGFSMLHHVQSTLAYNTQCESQKSPLGPGQLRLWDGREIAKWLPEEAKRVWALAKEAEKAGHCHLMLLSGLPDAIEDEGKTRRSQCSVFIFRSPDFAAEEVPHRKIGAIGRGTGAAACQALVQRLNSGHEGYFNSQRFEAGMPGGMLSNIGMSATRILEEHQPKGISPYLTFCWAYPQRVIIKVNNHTKYGAAWQAWNDIGSGINLPPDTTNATEKVVIGEDRPGEAVQFKVPNLARSWQELVTMLNAQGASAEGASA